MSWQDLGEMSCGFGTLELCNSQDKFGSIILIFGAYLEKVTSLFTRYILSTMSYALIHILLGKFIAFFRIFSRLYFKALDNRCFKFLV